MINKDKEEKLDKIEIFFKEFIKDYPENMKEIKDLRKVMNQIIKKERRTK